ncbi:MAG: carboxypeptidase-like regulatory domain-containing protein [Chitinophagaceae bacterium]
MYRFFILFFTAMQFLCVTNAQTNFIEGRILDSNHIPISSASIKVLLNDSTGLIKYFTLSDKDGFFKIELKPNTSKLWLQVSVVGFINYNQALLFPIQNGYQEIILQKFTGTLPAINVKAELPITKRGDTTIFKVAAFEKGNENNLGDLLKNLPGISLDEFGKVSFNGKKITRILIEEDDLFGSNYSTLTKNTGISGLDKIEVIENYKDNSRLENSANVGNETVLNLKV